MLAHRSISVHEACLFSAPAAYNPTTVGLSIHKGVTLRKAGTQTLEIPRQRNHLPCNAVPLGRHNGKATPQCGGSAILRRCLLAQFTDREVIVYQAYKTELGTFAAEHKYFGGGFSFERTSWIKPNFTWMMHRCGWASKQDQEVRFFVGGVL